MYLAHRRKHFLASVSNSVLVHDVEYAARNFSTSPLTISSLESDTYDYVCMYSIRGATADGHWDMTFNGDTGSNYNRYELQGRAGTEAASSASSQSLIQLNRAMRDSGASAGIFRILGESGDKRLLDDFHGNQSGVTKTDGYWTNTVDEITSITFTASTSSNIDAHIVMYSIPKGTSQGDWTLVNDTTWLNSSAQTLSGSLSGDTDLQYKIDYRNETTTGSSTFGLRFNGDSGNNYDAEALKNTNSAPSATSNLNTTTMRLNGSSTHKDIRGTFYVDAETGKERNLLGNNSDDETTWDQTLHYGMWDNTVDELTTIQLRGLGSDSIGEAQLYKRRVPTSTGDLMPFEFVEEHTFSGDFSGGHTFSGLTGDSVTLYKMEITGTSPATGELQVLFNNDTANNYRYQYFRGTGGTDQAAQDTSHNNIRLFDLIDSRPFNIVIYIYPQAGDKRSIIYQFGASDDRVSMVGADWSNTVDEITSMKVLANNTSSYSSGKITLSKLEIV